MSSEISASSLVVGVELTCSFGWLWSLASIAALTTLERSCRY